MKATAFMAGYSSAGRLRSEMHDSSALPLDPHKRLTHIPIVRNVGDLEAAEREVIAAYVALHGHEPGVLFTREAALKLLAERSGSEVKP